MSLPGEPPPRLLVVDDETPILFALRDFFSARGYAVDAAGERSAAEALLAERPYELMIVDLRLSAGEASEGLDLVAFARGKRPAMRIVVLTAYGSPEAEATALGLGADAMLGKPMPLPELAALADRLVGAAA